MASSTPNRFVNDLSRAELLEELRSYTDHDSLNHVATLDGRDVGDTKVLSDE